MTDDDYRHLGEEFLQRARLIREPELRRIYLELAAGYDELARFHERVQPLMDAAKRESD